MVRDLFSGALRRVGSVPWLRVAGVAAVALVALEIAGGWRPGFAPFTTLGEIYVDSPEVYTRERLVNDRYDQDHWLRRQLEALDRDPQLVARATGSTVQAGGAAGAPQTAPAPGLDFARQFEIKAGIRERVRQMMLENMLDDRHDLSGNSMYGFKFDTTVVQGDNTRRRAAVRIRARIEPFFGPPEAGAPNERTLPPHLAAALAGEGAEARKLDRYNTHYLHWLENIESRLNNYVENYYAYNPPRCADLRASAEAGIEIMDAVTLRALQTVLSLSPHHMRPSLEDPSLLQLGERRLQLPDPWRRFFEISRKEIGTDCGVRPRFQVRDAFDVIYVLGAEPDGRLPEWAASAYYAIRPFAPAEEDGPPRLLAVSYDGQINSLEEYNALQPRYDLPAGMIRAAETAGRLTEFCHDPEAGRGGCPPGRTVRAFSVQSGLFNLIEQLQRQDAYAYAVFPKMDAEGVLVSRELGAGAGAEGGLGFGLGRSERRADAASVLVGYADGRAAMTDPLGRSVVDLGWIVTPPPTGDSVQRTQMALISAPAWADAITFEVRTGWLDSDARDLIDERVHEVRVPLPPDFEALDIVIWGGALDVRRRPVILDDFMDPPNAAMMLTACQPAAILVPGSRLWRSTAVTLGGQRATKISVLPNMDGIIAEFDRIGAPSNPSGANMALTEPRVLRVWTSEGTATSKKPINVVAPAGMAGACPPHETDAAPAAPVAVPPADGPTSP